MADELAANAPEESACEAILAGVEDGSPAHVLSSDALAQLIARAKGSSSEASMWDELDEMGVTPRQVVATLLVCVTRAKDERRIRAAEAYMRLCGTPDAAPRHPIHPIAFAAALLALKRRTVSSEDDSGEEKEQGEDEEDEKEQEDEEAPGKRKKKPVGKKKKGNGERSSSGGEVMASTSVVGDAVDAVVELVRKVALKEF
jgi:hypothetical protein